MGRPREWTEAKIEALGKDLEEYFLNDETVMFYGEWLARRGLHYEHLKRFQSVSEAFRSTVKRVTALQEDRLIRAGMGAGKNPGMAIFVLKNKHGYADKVEQRIESTQHHTVSGDAASMTPEELRQKIFELTERAKKN